MTDTVQRNFAGGEIAPSLYGRADQTKFMSGCRTAKNFFIRKSGGLANRPGFRFIMEAKFLSSDRNIRLQKFVFSDDQTYVLVHTDDIFQVIKNGARVTHPAASAWIGATTYASGEVALYGGVTYVSKWGGNFNNPPDSFPAWWHPLANGIYEQRHDISGPALRYLRWQQSGDLLFNVLGRGGYNFGGPASLVFQRNADDEWAQVSEGFTPRIAAPVLNPLTGTAGTPSQPPLDYVVVAVGGDGDSVMSSSATSINLADPTLSNPITVSWTAVTGAVAYEVYRRAYGIYGYIGITETTTFKDYGATPNIAQTPGQYDIFGGGPSSFAYGGPSVISFIQQRLVLAALRDLPEKVFMSRTGAYYSFLASTPPTDDDMVSFTLAGLKVSQVRAIVEIGNPIVFTQSGEWVLLGDADGAITPTTITPRQMAFNGISEWVQPVVIDDTAVYVQARGTVLRDLKYKVEGDGYEGRDLSVFSSHLFKKKTVVAMDYAANPHPLIWCVLDDGTLLSLSYLREHAIWGWTRHETAGFVMDCCVVPEGQEDALYIAVRRTTSGADKYCIERLESREDQVLDDCFFVDSGLSYDGRNTDVGHSMTMISQASMTVNDWFVLQSSASYFSAGDVGNAIRIDQAGEHLTLNIKEYISATQVRVEPSRDLTGPDAHATFVPLIGVATVYWAKAVDEFSGLSHLEGNVVAILADGAVVSNGYESPTYTVSGGSVTIPRPAVRVHIGLPYVSDFESLDVDTRDQPLRQHTKMLSHVGVLVENTSSLKAGSNFNNLTEYKIRTDEDPMGEPTPLKTGYFDVSVSSGWDEQVRVCVRQDNPLPAMVGGLIPRYIIGG